MSLPLISDVSDSPWILKVLPILFNCGLMSLAFWLIPNTPVQIEHALLGGALPSVLAEIAKWVFSSFIAASSFQVANELGGDGNLEAVAFIKDLNETLYRDFPDIQTIAEEATDWPGISKPTNMDGLGFGMKWMMGWMHDTLDYFKADPLMRSGLQDKFSFSMMYYYDENFMLPLSHDEVVHGKSPMIYKMPGDEWQKFANLRLLYTYMYMHPGAKLLFMGNEFAATTEWDYKSELPWHLLAHPSHGGMKYCVQKLNELYTSHPALYELQFDPAGFEWIDLQHRSESVMAFKRKGKNPAGDIVVIINATPVVRHNWKISVQGKPVWKEIFNSDHQDFWGTGVVYNPAIPCVCVDTQNNWHELTLQLPALSAVVLQ